MRVVRPCEHLGSQTRIDSTGIRRGERLTAVRLTGHIVVKPKETAGDAALRRPTGELALRAWY
jgi:hypothetical protein